MRRVEVKAKDVMLPFGFLFLVNFLVLLSWTCVAPLRWTRVELASFDQFGRSVQSYGTCFPPRASLSSYEISSRSNILVTLGFFNLLAVILANYQCYKSRNVPSDFNESRYIGLSMLCILEGFLIGIPFLFFVIGEPTASFVLGSVFIAFLCIAILIPTFASKVFMRQRRTMLRRTEWNQTWRQYDFTASLRERQRRTLHSSHGTRRSSTHASSDYDSVAAIRARVAQSDLQETSLTQTSQKTNLSRKD